MEFIIVSGSSKIQTLSFDSSSIKTEIYSDGNTCRLLKLLSSSRNVQVYN